MVGESPRTVRDDGEGWRSDRRADRTAETDGDLSLFLLAGGADGSAAGAGVDCGEGRVVHAVGGFQVSDHLQVVLPGAGALWQEGYQHGGRGPGGEDDGLARGETWAAGSPSTTTRARYVWTASLVAAGGPVWAIFSPEFSRPLMVDLVKARMTFSDGGQGAEVRRSRMQSASAMHWSTMRSGVGALGELDDRQVGLLGVDGVLKYPVGQFVDAGREQGGPTALDAHLDCPSIVANSRYMLAVPGRVHFRSYCDDVVLAIAVTLRVVLGV